MNLGGVSGTTKNNNMPEVMVDIPKALSKLATLILSVVVTLTFTIDSQKVTEEMGQAPATRPNLSQPAQMHAQVSRERTQGFGREVLDPASDHWQASTANFGSRAQYPALAPEERRSSK
jgi:predicted metalloprotease